MQMIKRTSILPLFLLISFVFTGLHGQQAITSAGGEGSGTGGTLSYTAGQVRYITMEGSNGTLSEGVQQPFEILELTGTDLSSDLALDVLLFPNPAGEYIILKVEDSTLEELSYQLVNMGGQILESGSIKESEVQINMAQRASAPYLIKITYQSKEANVFKIIKK